MHGTFDDAFSLSTCRVQCAKQVLPFLNFSAWSRHCFTSFSLTNL